jgi:hypothetical protein
MLMRHARYTSFGGTQPVREPFFELVEPCWRMKGPSRREFQCGIYRTEAPGFEVRAGYGEDLINSQLVRDIGAARALAAQWRVAVLAKGSFEEV